MLFLIFSSYILAMNCISDLKALCPSRDHRRIDVTLYNLEGARNELGELCGDDKIYESEFQAKKKYVSLLSHAEKIRVGRSAFLFLIFYDFF